MNEVGIKLAAVGAVQVQRDLQGVGEGLDKMGRATNALQGTLGSLRGALAGLIGAATVSQFVQAADSVTQLNNQLRLATGSAQAGRAAYGALFDIAQRSRVGFVQLGETFASITRATDGLGLSQQRLLTVTEAIGNAITISGGSAAGAQAALTQLGQGLASGALRGEELNSVLEQTPRLAKALADGMGVSIGQLRALGQQGKLTAEAVIAALEGQSKKLREEVGGSVKTVAQAFTILQNSATNSVGQLDRASGASVTLAGAIIGIAGAIDTVGEAAAEHGDAIAAVAGALTGAAAAAGALALGAGILRLAPAIAGVGAALAANPAVALLLGVGTAAGALWAGRKSLEQDWVRARLTATEEQLQDMRPERDRANGILLTQPDSIRAKVTIAEFAEMERAAAGYRAQLDAIEEAKYGGKRRPANEGGGGLLSRGTVSGPDPRPNDDAAKLIASGVTLADSLRAQDEGLSPDFLAKLDSLRAAYAASALNADRYAEAVRGLVDQQPAVKKAAEDQSKAVELEARATLDAAKSREKYLESLDASLESGEQELQRLRDEYIGLTVGKEVLAERVLLRLEEKANALELQAIRAADMNLDMAEAERLRSRAQQLRDEIALRRSVAGATAGKEVEAANTAAANAAAADWQRTSDQIGQSLSNALMEGGKSAAEYLKGLFRSMVLQPIIKAIVQPVANSIAGFFGMGGGQGGAASAGGGGSGLGGLLSGAGMGGSIVSTIAAGIGSLGKLFGSSTLGEFSSGMSGAFLPAGQAGPTTIGASGATGAGAAAGSFLQTAGSLAGSFLMGRGIGQLISGGYTLGGSGGNALVNIGALGGVIGGTIAGVINRAFGRKLVDAGFEGDFSAAGFDGNQYEKYKGGWFASDKTKRKDLDPELAAVLDAGAMAANAQLSSYIDVLGLPAKQLEGFSQSIRVSLKGLSPEEAQQAIADSVQAYQEAQAQQFAAVLQPFVEAGETAVQTLQRLTILQTFAEDINTLGGVFGRVARSGPQAVQQLAEFAGGLESLTQQITGFVANYFTADEIAGLRSQEFVGALTDVGIAPEALAGLDTREEFRALVEAQDVSTEVGRQQLAALLGQAENFAGLTDYLAETGQTVTQAATLAPDSDVLAPLFDSNAIATDQLSVMGNVEAAVNGSNGLLQQILDQLRGNGRGRSTTPAAVYDDTEVYLPGQGA